jgi:hypothetical protein
MAKMPKVPKDKLTKQVIKDRNGTLRTTALIVAFSAAILFSGPGTVSSQEIDDCLECHQDRNLTRTDASGKVHSQYVNKDRFLRSVHGEMDYTCVDCHEDAEAESHPAEGIPDVSCGECHEEALKQYEKSKHGQLLKSGNPDAPQCYDCHSKHEIFYSDDPQSSTSPENVSLTCGKCHENEAYGPSPVLSLVTSRVKGHGKVNMSCDFSTRRCTDCHFEVINHGSDELKPQVCANCHEAEKSGFIFGTIHKSGVFKSSFLSVVMVLCYIAAIAGIVFYFKAGADKKEAEGEVKEG